MYINICYIEDNRLDIQNVLKCLNEQQPSGYVIRYQTETFDLLQTAIKQLYAREPDIILLDLNLPDSSGIETFLTLRQSIKSPIIILTGMMDLPMALDCMKQGASGYIVKDWIKDNPLLLHFYCLHIHELNNRETELKDFVQERLGKFRPLIPRCKFCISRTGEFRLRDESTNDWLTFERYFEKYGIYMTDGICQECLKEKAE